MKKYHAEDGLVEIDDGWSGSDMDVYLASDVVALETRLIAAETAILMATAGSVKDVAKYMDQYPDPYIPS